MTIGQLFEGLAARKTVWSKRDGVIKHRAVSAASTIKPKKKIETVKSTKEN